MKPHHGNLIFAVGLLGLALVVASLVLSVVVVTVVHDPAKPAGTGSVFLRSSGVSVVGFVVGFAAHFLARRELHKMHVGRRDRSGRPRANAGRLCGLVAMWAAAANVAITLILWLLVDRAGTDGVASWLR